VNVTGGYTNDEGILYGKHPFSIEWDVFTEIFHDLLSAQHAIFAQRIPFSDAMSQPEPSPLPFPRTERAPANAMNRDDDGASPSAIAAQRRRWTASHWIGLALLLVPFFTIPIALFVAGTGFGALLSLPLIPPALLLGVIGLVVLLVLALRGRPDGAGQVLGSSRSEPRRGMRGDHPSAPSIDYPEPRPPISMPHSASPDPRTTPRDARCSHCGVVFGVGEAICPRCGARR
jgi:hypothetical protein